MRSELSNTNERQGEGWQESSSWNLSFLPSLNLRIELLVSEDCEAGLGKFCELLEKFFIGCGEIETRFTCILTSSKNLHQLIWRPPDAALRATRSLARSHLSWVAYSTSVVLRFVYFSFRSILTAIFYE